MVILHYVYAIEASVTLVCSVKPRALQTNCAVAGSSWGRSRGDEIV